MRKIFIAMMLASSICRGAPVVDPSTCFDGYPWTNQIYKQWQSAERTNLMTRQLWYTLSDRCFYAGITNRPYNTNSFILSCGYPTNMEMYSSYAGKTATTTVQLLEVMMLTNCVESFEYLCPVNPTNPATAIVKTNAAGVGRMTLYAAMDTALGDACVRYVPSSLWAGLDAFMATNGVTNIPTYVNVGAVLYDAGYTNCVSNITWNVDSDYIVSCDWSWNEYAWPDGSSNNLVWKVAAADCRAACIAQLKYMATEAVAYNLGTSYNSFYFDGMGNVGWGWADGVLYATNSPAGNAGTIGDAALASSDESDWVDDNMTKTTCGTTNTWSWTSQSNLTGEVNFGGTDPNWPDDGWPVKFTWTITYAIATNDPAHPSATNYIWRLIGDVEGGSWSDFAWEGEYNDTYDGTDSGIGPWSIDWSMISRAMTYSIESRDASTNYTTNSVIYYEPLISGWSTNVTDYKKIRIVTTNSDPGAISIDTYCNVAYPVGTAEYVERFDFNYTGSPGIPYKRKEPRTYSYSVTNIAGPSFTTNSWTNEVVDVTTNPAGDYVVWNTNDFEDVFTDGSWSFALSDIVNGVWARALVSSVRSYEPIPTNTPGYTSARLYLRGTSFTNSNPYSWDDYVFEAPFASCPAVLEGKCKFIGTVADELILDDGTVYLFYELSSGLTAADKPYDGKSGPRLLWGVDKGWFVVEYDFPKRKTSTPE